MAWLLELRLIRFFGFYLALMFLLSTMVRLRQYGTILGLCCATRVSRSHAARTLTWQ